MRTGNYTATSNMKLVHWPLMGWLLLPAVQCYAMHGQNVNLLCVCVCVSVTLSVNSPTGQTPQRIFTVDSIA